jgi:O-acetylserine/cysteine efflux transporter
VKRRDRLLAMLVAGCWGLNFPATEIALEHFPPLLMVALRFGLVAIPAVALVPRPKVKWRWLLGTGLGLGMLQFAFLYLGMAAGMPSGLASLVLQASAPFTLLLAGVWLGERLTSRQALSTLIAMAGLTAIAIHRGQNAALLPMVLTLCGALGWAIGNVCSRRAQAPNPLHLTLWMSVVPPIPLLVASLIFEGPPRIHSALLGLTSLRALPSVLGLIYIVVVATLIGYGLWNTLLARYPSSTVAPFSMLVPVVGVASSWLLFGERPDIVELVAGAVVIGGVLLGSLIGGPEPVAKITSRRREPKPAPHVGGAPSPRPTQDREDHLVPVED